MDVCACLAPLQRRVLGVKQQVLPAGNGLCLEPQGHSSSPGPAAGGLACAGDAAGICRAMDAGQELRGAPRR